MTGNWKVKFLCRVTLVGFEVISGENKPRIQVGVVEKVKGMDWCSDREKYLRKLALDLDILHLLKA